MSELVDRIADNVAEVRERIAAAARRSGRDPSAITLVCATKYVELEEIRAVIEAGCHDLGESRPQQLWQRAAALQGQPIRWHLIGHLQRNKVARTLPLVHLIHSVDSRRLLDALDEAARRIDQQADILLEVNVSGDAAKHGFAPDDLEPLLPDLPRYSALRVRGLMTMASLEGGLDTARRDFSHLRTLRDRLRPKCPDGASMEALSMGMSGDYEIAIEEGATIVRIGSALFEGAE